MKKNRLPAPLIASLLAFSWMFFFFSDVFVHPNKHLFNDQGDGIKAFFVYADHIKNDESYHQQRNMNYPYGQTFVYTDGQPAIANAVKFFSSYIPFFQTHCIAIYNYLILCSFIVCAWILALIFQRLKLPALFVILGAFCITALSPHIWRISGHPTMSYACFFPLSWYLFLKTIDSGFKIRFILLSVINSAFWFFVHPYLGMVITFFYGLYFLLMLVSKSRKSLGSIRAIISILFMVFIPLILLKLYTFKVDHHLMRSEFPWGFWVFYANPATIFLPHSGFFAPFFDALFKLHSAEWNMEKLHYIGLAADLVLLFTIFRLIKFVAKKKYSRLITPVRSTELNISLLASVLLLLFAMCIPFKFGLQSIVDHLGFLRQFRALGRFAWAFYYVATVFGVYVFYLLVRVLNRRKLRWLSTSLSILFFSLFIIEAYPDIREKSKWAVMPVNLFNEQLLPQEYCSLIEEVNKVKENYQCIVTLPFFHVGTENFGIEYEVDNIRTSCVVSYWCNIPMMASSAARSPILEGKNIMQFFSPGYIKKEIENDLPSKKDFLVIYNKERLSEREYAMLENSAKIYDNGKYELWSLSYENAFRDSSKDLWTHFVSENDSLADHGIFRVSGYPDTLVYSGYDSLLSDFVYKGKGALQAKKKDFTVLFYAEGKLKPDEDYTVSFWYYNKGELRNQLLCALEECDREGNNCRWDIFWEPRTSMVIDGDWSLIEKKFRVKDGKEKIRIFVHGDENSNQNIYIDEFLLRPSSTDAFSNIKSGEDSFLFYNNWWLKE